MDCSSFSKICTLLGIASVFLVEGSSMMGVTAFMVGAVSPWRASFRRLSRKKDGTRKISDGKMFGVLAIIALLMISGHRVP
jgi:hypothetical protein